MISHLQSHVAIECGVFGGAGSQHRLRQNVI